MNYRCLLGACIAVITLTVVTACTPSAEETGDAASEQRDTLPVFRVVAPFTAIDHNGGQFSTASVAGKYWIGSFFFTRCQTVCPALNRVQAQIQREFGSKLSYVSITSDPDYDTPAVLAAYASEFAQPGGTWLFVTMPQDSMLKVASQGFGLISPAEPEMHSTRFVLVDPTMQVRGFYDSEDTTAIAKLRSDLQGLGL